MEKGKYRQRRKVLTGHLVQGRCESPVFLFQTNKSSCAFDLLAVVGLHNKEKREIYFEPVPNYSSCTQPRGLLPSGALVALPIVKKVTTRERNLHGSAESQESKRKLSGPLEGQIGRAHV